MNESTNESTPFSLAPRLATDTLFLQRDALIELRLVDDRRWPWLMLVPCVADARELHDLSPRTGAELFKRVRAVSAALQEATACTSINVAALGNVEPQLHLHVVARRPGDPNWPAPIWGFGTAQRRDDDALPAFARRVATALADLDRLDRD